MEFKEFSSYVCEKVGERLGDSYKLSSAPVLKNNGILLHGISYSKEWSPVAPTVYMETFYEAYSNGLSLTYVIDSMTDVFLNNDYDFDLDFSEIMDFEKMKDRICCKVVNYERNREMTEECPCIQMMDLCVMFYISVGASNGEEGSVKVTHSLMKAWGKDINELYTLALFNTKKLLGVDVTNIRDVLIDIINSNRKEETGGAEYIDELVRSDPAPMYVLSNNRRFYGATCLLYTEELEKFANALGADLFILPSSIHELILIPDYEEANPGFLYDMVREVNEKEVSEHDYLSTNVYKFDRKTKQMFDIFGV